ncbi:PLASMODESMATA CALLOSE-BINDING PROTEIN 5-like [Euphorbia lathyris]|uniref:PLASMODESMATA CALLOSE-BINDING PROTEIN 5-like n=1 Tax=Euphorbia lathyris TaxID=212925 RepID=UPI00331328BF
MVRNSSSGSLLMLLLVLVLAFPRCSKAQKGIAPRDLWCVAKNNADDQSLQAAIDWACSAGGANCGPIQQNGPCFDPSDIQTTASWAFNDYYLKNGLSDDACSFSNTAALTSLNPSHDNCKFPSSLSVKNDGISSSTASTSTTTIIGMGPASEDLSGCSQIAGSWFWPFVIGELLYLFIVMNRAN